MVNTFVYIVRLVIIFFCWVCYSIDSMTEHSNEALRHLTQSDQHHEVHRSGSLEEEAVVRLLNRDLRGESHVFRAGERENTLQKVARMVDGSLVLFRRRMARLQTPTGIYTGILYEEDAIPGELLTDRTPHESTAQSSRGSFVSRLEMYDSEISRMASPSPDAPGMTSLSMHSLPIEFITSLNRDYLLSGAQLFEASRTLYARDGIHRAETGQFYLSIPERKNYPRIAVYPSPYERAEMQKATISTSLQAVDLLDGVALPSSLHFGR